MALKSFCIGEYCIRAEVDYANLPPEIAEEIDAAMRQAVLEESFYAYKKFSVPDFTPDRLTEEQMESHISYLEFMFEHIFKKELITETVE